MRGNKNSSTQSHQQGLCGQSKLKIISGLVRTPTADKINLLSEDELSEDYLIGDGRFCVPSASPKGHYHLFYYINIYLALIFSLFFTIFGKLIFMRPEAHDSFYLLT